MEPMVAVGDALSEMGVSTAPRMPLLGLGATRSPSPGRGSSDSRNPVLARRPGSPVAGGRTLGRSQSASRARSSSPLTPRCKKTSRQLRHELGQIITNTAKMMTRVEQAHLITEGTIADMGRSAKCSRESLVRNSRAMRNAMHTHNKPINEALTKLAESSEKAVAELARHEASLRTHLGLLAEICSDLDEHRAAREAQLSAVGTQADGGTKLSDANSHAAINIASQREDAARSACMGALKSVRLAQAGLQTRKSALQLAVRRSRETQVRQAKAKQTGNFGSTGERVTDPASRKLPSSPDVA